MTYQIELSPDVPSAHYRDQRAAERAIAAWPSSRAAQPTGRVLRDGRAVRSSDECGHCGGSHALRRSPGYDTRVVAGACNCE